MVSEMTQSLCRTMTTHTISFPVWLPRLLPKSLFCVKRSGCGAISFSEWCVSALNADPECGSASGSCRWRAQWCHEKPAIYGNLWQFLGRWLGLFRCFHIFWHLYCTEVSFKTISSITPRFWRVSWDGARMPTILWHPRCTLWTRVSCAAAGLRATHWRWWRWMTMPTKSYKHHWIWLAAGDMDSDERHMPTLLFAAPACS